MGQALRKTETQTVKGRVERYVSGPTADGFAIVSITLKNGTRLSIKGKNVLVGFSIGETIEVRGCETNHPRFGKQMQAFDARTVDDGPSGLVRWLSEAGFEGIGAARAKAIVAALGENAIERIVAGDDASKNILGTRFADVREALTIRHCEAKYGSMLAALDIGRGTRAKIFEEFGDKTGDVVAKNPFQLIHNIEGIAFRTADQIARNAGMKRDSEERILAAAHDVLRTAENDGHSWCPMSEIIIGAAQRTGLEKRVIANVVDEAECQGVEAVLVEVEGETIRGWALERLSRQETYFARAVARKLRQPKRCTQERAEQLIDKHARIAKVELEPEQREAAIMALIEPFCVITGFPGTGKTTVLDIIRRAMQEMRLNIDMGSPTGKAAQRMHQKTGVRARTMHRMLESNGKQFKRNARNAIDAQVIPIDEGSMMDISLAAAFSAAWGTAQILLIGDADQIASVGAGRVFGDLVASPHVPTVRLTTIRRQAKGSSIATGAQNIRDGKMPEWGQDLVFIEKNDNVQIAHEVEQIFRMEMKDGNDVQVLSPGHAAECGTIAMNNALATVSPGADSVFISMGAEARVGDKVIQTINKDEHDVFNGDGGIISAINKDHIVVTMDGPDGPQHVKYDNDRLTELSLAWALSVHKAQGSEYEVVIMVMTTSHWKLLRRTLLNTGITRGKKRCYVIGSKRALMQAISFDDGNMRRTQLQSLLDSMVD